MNEYEIELVHKSRRDMFRILLDRIYKDIGHYHNENISTSIIPEARSTYMDMLEIIFKIDKEIFDSNFSINADF